jgi:hypothetical protein
MNSKDAFGVRFTRSWVTLYTRSLSEAVGERRRAEMESDLWEQLSDTSSGRTSTQVLDRCLRGIPADVWWRYRTLLEQREVRQRNQNMTRNILINWWGAITAVLGTALLTLGVGGILFGEGGAASGFVWAGASFISGGLMLGGLALIQRHVITGSRMIVAGAAVTVLGVFLIPVAALIVIGGLWTGHLRLFGTADDQHLQSARPQPADLTARWYLWLVAAIILVVVGLGALAILGDGQTATGQDDDGLIASLAYFAWILSWLGALISTGMGIGFGAKRGIVRHRTRPA